MRRLPRAFPTLISAPDLLVLCFVLSCATLASDSPGQAWRPRITGIDHVTIYVSDVEKSRRFYSDILGLTVGCPQYSGSETCFLVRPSEQRILLKQVPTEIKIDAHKSWLAEIAFATDDVSDARQYLLAHGFQPGPIQKDSDGEQSFRVRDAEGNPIAFVHRSPSKSGYAPAAKQIGSRVIHAGFVVKEEASKCRCHFSKAVMRRSCGRDELRAPIGQYGRRKPHCEQHTELRSDREESRSRGFGEGYRSEHLAAVAQPKPIRRANPVTL
jgi:catechol 2,3-dioxygenase-like lactoylglutathione lyase family enzyme